MIAGGAYIGFVAPVDIRCSDTPRMYGQIDGVIFIFKYTLSIKMGPSIRNENGKTGSDAEL